MELKYAQIIMQTLKVIDTMYQNQIFNAVTTSILMQILANN